MIQQKEMKTITFTVLLTTALMYTVLGVSGLSLAIPPGYASPVYPAAGLAIALALYFGNRILPGIWFGSFAVNLIFSWQLHRIDLASIFVAGIIAGGVILQTWAGRSMILYWFGNTWRRLQTEKDIVLFLLVAAPLSCIISATTGNGILYGVGIIPAEEFVHSWWTWWGGDTVGVLIFAPLTLLFLFRQESPWKERQITVGLPMAIALCLVAAAFFDVSHQDQKEEMSEIKANGQNIAQALSHRFIAHQEALFALKRLIEVTPNMTFSQFEYFTKITLRDNGDIFALSYNPYVLDSARSKFEQSMVQAGMDSFRIMERDSAKQLGTAPQHPFYVPVGFIAPLEGNRPAIGFNIHSEPIRRNAIERAISSEYPAVTAPIQLVQEKRKQPGVLILNPAYQVGATANGNGIKTLTGFAVGVFIIDEMVRIATRDLVPTGIAFRLTDDLAKADDRLLFQSDEGRNNPQEPYVWRMQLTMADRQWSLEVFPSEDYLRQHHSHFGFVVAVIALLIAALLQLMLLAMTGRTSVIQQKVHEQTALISKAKQESDSIIRNFLDSLIVIRTDLTIVRINQATCTLLGYREEELINEPVTMLFQDRPELIQDIFSFYKEKGEDNDNSHRELRNVELNYLTRDGGVLPISINISLLTDDDGTIIGVVAGAKDISKLKATLDQVARQKDYIEHLFEIVPQGLLTLDPSGEIRKRNLEFKKIIRLLAEQWQLPEEKITQDIQEKLQTILPHADNAIFSISYLAHVAYFRCSAATVPLFNNIENVVAISDITDERRQEAARRLLATVIEQTADSIVLTDPEGIIRYVNSATTINSGWSTDELVGQPARIFKSGLTSAAVYQELWQTILQGGVWSDHLSNRKKDGSIIEENVTISPVHNEEGALSHFVAIKHDVTDLTRLQRQLLQAQKMEAIGQLAAGMAHEINTPLQYVRNNITFFTRAFGEISLLLADYKHLQQQTPRIDLPEDAVKRLKNGKIDFLLEEIPESIDEIEEGINRVVKIISAMKEFSHPGTGEKVSIDLNRALESTITVSRNEWKYVAEMVTDLGPVLPMVVCLPDQINQAVLNLIVNSAHAIKETGASISGDLGRITISTRQDRDWVELRISDTGAGIAEENLDKIFEPFFTTKEIGKGTGQGLAITHDIIVNKHGGTIDCISESGKGTTFIVRLPPCPSISECVEKDINLKRDSRRFVNDRI